MLALLRCCAIHSTHVESLIDNSNSNSFRWLDKYQIVIIGFYVFSTSFTELGKNCPLGGIQQSIVPCI